MLPKLKFSIFQRNIQKKQWCHMACSTSFSVITSVNETWKDKIKDKPMIIGFNGYCVFYGVECWSGVLEWSIGVESNFGVVNGLVLCEPTAKSH